MSLLIQEVPPTAVPMELLLLADLSEEKVRGYLRQSRCFVASEGGIALGACIVQPRESGVQELMNIAVHPDHQKSGNGTMILKWVIDLFRNSGTRQLEVGTGTFGYQLAFYQRQGFRVSGIDRDFFVRNYEEPVIDEGMQLFDMLRLTLRFTDSDA